MAKQKTVRVEILARYHVDTKPEAYRTCNVLDPSIPRYLQAYLDDGATEVGVRCLGTDYTTDEFFALPWVIEAREKAGE